MAALHCDNSEKWKCAAISGIIGVLLGGTLVILLVNIMVETRLSKTDFSLLRVVSLRCASVDIGPPFIIQEPTHLSLLIDKCGIVVNNGYKVQLQNTIACKSTEYDGVNPFYAILYGDNLKGKKIVSWVEDDLSARRMQLKEILDLISQGKDDEAYSSISRVVFAARSVSDGVAGSIEGGGDAPAMGKPTEEGRSNDEESPGH